MPPNNPLQMKWNNWHLASTVFSRHTGEILSGGPMPLVLLFIVFAWSECLWFLQQELSSNKKNVNLFVWLQFGNGWTLQQPHRVLCEKLQIRYVWQNVASNVFNEAVCELPTNLKNLGFVWSHVQYFECSAKGPRERSFSFSSFFVSDSQLPTHIHSFLLWKNIGKSSVTATNSHPLKGTTEDIWKGTSYFLWVQAALFQNIKNSSIFSVQHHPQKMTDAAAKNFIRLMQSARQF